MRRGAVYLGFCGIPHAVITLTFAIEPPVRQNLVIIDTQELVRRESPGPLQLFPQSRAQRTAAHLPEFRHLHPLGVCFQCCPKRAEELGPAL